MELPFKKEKVVLCKNLDVKDIYYLIKKKKIFFFFQFLFYFDIISEEKNSYFGGICDTFLFYPSSNLKSISIDRLCHIYDYIQNGIGCDVD